MAADHPVIAKTTQETTYPKSNMVVVHMEVGSKFLRRSLTNIAHSVLIVKEFVVLLKRDAVRPLEVLVTP